MECRWITVDSKERSIRLVNMSEEKQGKKPLNLPEEGWQG